MNKFDTRSMTFLGVIIGICFIFVMVVWNAFDYLPQDTADDSIAALIKEESVKQESPQKETVADDTENVSSEDEISDDNIDEPVTKIAKKSEEDSIKPLEVIPDEELTSGEKISADSQEKENPEEKLLRKAGTLKADKQYTAAIAEYENLIRTTNDTKLKATCYEEIATIYGIVKRYGSALSAAQKAYNLYPTSAREVLLARLYYKTGELNKATERVNNVLKRDFGVND